MTSLPKVYLCCSIRAGRVDNVPYENLVSLLSSHCQVLNPFVTDKPGASEGCALSDVEIHERDMLLLKESDIIVAEVTQPSFGVGYEVGRAVELKKPVLCIYIEVPGKKVSAMIGWAENKPTGAPVQLKRYSSENDLAKIFHNYFTGSHSAIFKKQVSLDWESYEPM